MRLTTSRTPRTRAMRCSASRTGSSAGCTPDSTTTPSRTATSMSEGTTPSSSWRMRRTSAAMRSSSDSGSPSGTVRAAQPAHSKPTSNNVMSLTTISSSRGSA
jgi:hypothetical protein